MTDHISRFPSSRLRMPAAGLLLGSLSLVAACGGNGGGTAGNGEPVGDPQPGGTLSFAVGSDDGCIDPQQTGSNDSIYPSRQLVDSLTDQDPKTGEILPWLAEEWEINDDATEYTFTLREGVTFADGTPLDAEVVAANLDRATELGSRGHITLSYIEGYEETEVIDERTFTVRFEEPSAQFLQATSTHALGILHPDSVELSDDERCESVEGSGPFVLESYTPDSSIEMSAREGYDWGSEIWDNQGEPYVDGIEFTIVPESGVRAGSLQSGQVDVIGNIAPQDLPQLESANAQILPRTNPGMPFGLGLNQEEELFQDEAVREAISLAIDREEIVNTAYTEDAPASTSVVASTTPDHTDLSEYLQHDPDAAREVLESAGWELGEDEVYERDGERLEFTVLWFDNAPTNAPTLELIQQQLNSTGFDVSLEEGQVAEFGTRVAESSFDIIWSNATRADADILRTSYGASSPYQIEDEELFEALRELSAEPDPDARAEIAAEVQEQVVSEYYTVPVVDLTTTLASRAEVHGVRFDSGSRVYLNDVWIEESAQ